MDTCGRTGVLKSFVDWWPRSLPNAKPQLLRLGRAFKVTEFVICPECNAVYDFEDCYVKHGSKLVPRHCQRVDFPNHLQKSRCKKCGVQLLKQVKHKMKISLVPFRLYCYNSVINSLQRLVSQPEFLKTCEHWRTRETDDMLGDIYDGKIFSM